MLKITTSRRAVQQGCSLLRPRVTSPATAAICYITELQSAKTHAFIAVTWP